MGCAVAQEWENYSGPGSLPRYGEYDARRQRFVRFPSDDAITWEWSGSAWQTMVTGLPPFGAPINRRSPGTCFDSDRGVVYLFGGLTVTTLADLWSWNGLAWTQELSVAGPARRAFARMAYDSVRQRVVLYGGEDGATMLNDTWEYDGFGWTRTIASGPAWVNTSLMVFDAARARMVLLAGGTHLYNGTAWVAMAGDSSSVGAALVDDPARQRVVAYRRTVAPELREWNGTTWSTVATGLPTLSAPTAYFDRGSNRVAFLDDRLGAAVMTWDGTAVAIETNDLRTAAMTMFYDPVRRNLVSFGGSRAEPVDETWIWANNRWAQVFPANKPTARWNAGSTFDTLRGIGLVFGGSGANGVGQVNDLWSWNGTTWQQLATGGPPGAFFPALAYDSQRDRVVLVGGLGSGPASRAHWEWDGTNWIQFTFPVGVPAPPFGLGSLAYDPTRGICVYYIGVLLPPQTWTWNGTAWNQVPTAAAPSGFTSMFFDPSVGKVSIVGGGASFGIWDFDGATWTRRTYPDYQIDSVQAAAYDTVRGRIDLFDGRHMLESHPVVPVADYYGTACGQPAAVLMTHRRPRRNEADFALDLAVAPNAVCAFGLSTTQANTPLGGGCTLLVGPLLATTLTVADGMGFTSWSLPIPDSASLVGISVFAQGGGLTAGGLVTSQGIQLLVGD